MSLEGPIFFLATVAFISLSGVMMPGPTFAATVAQGYRDGRAGLGITLGHALIEVPLIALIFLGFATILSDDSIIATIGIVGGAIILWMGVGMLRARDVIITQEGALKRRASFDGVLSTASNPYWLLWWATVGAALVATATEFGIWMLPAFVIVHISCDAGWNILVSRTVNRSKGLWNVKWHHLLIVASGGIMVIFGLYFLISSIEILL
ncbi:MAG: LysE family transporter [Methanomassiliicoccales archaeon]|nr:MAG: LysE family transporter [Methanomassiliicoccales archaeon]